MSSSPMDLLQWVKILTNLYVDYNSIYTLSLTNSSNTVSLGSSGKLNLLKIEYTRLSKIFVDENLKEFFVNNNVGSFESSWRMAK
jgi:hypothetical protein